MDTKLLLEALLSGGLTFGITEALRYGGRLGKVTEAGLPGYSTYAPLLGVGAGTAPLATQGYSHGYLAGAALGGFLAAVRPSVFMTTAETDEYAINSFRKTVDGSHIPRPVFEHQIDWDAFYGRKKLTAAEQKSWEWGQKVVQLEQPFARRSLQMDLSKFEDTYKAQNTWTTSQIVQMKNSQAPWFLKHFGKTIHTDTYESFQELGDMLCGALLAVMSDPKDELSRATLNFFSQNRHYAAEPYKQIRTASLLFGQRYLEKFENSTNRMWEYRNANQQLVSKLKNNLDGIDQKLFYYEYVLLKMKTIFFQSTVSKALAEQLLRQILVPMELMASKAVGIIGAIATGASTGGIIGAFIAAIVSFVSSILTAVSDRAKQEKKYEDFYLTIEEKFRALFLLLGIKDKKELPLYLSGLAIEVLSKNYDSPNGAAASLLEAEQRPLSTIGVIGTVTDSAGFYYRDVVQMALFYHRYKYVYPVRMQHVPWDLIFGFGIKDFFEKEILEPINYKQVDFDLFYGGLGHREYLSKKPYLLLYDHWREILTSQDFGVREFGFNAEALI